MKFTQCQLVIYLPLLILSAVTTLFIFRLEFFTAVEVKPEVSEIMAKLSSLENESVVLSSEKIEAESIVSDHGTACQPILANPPEIIKAVYLTSWSASTESRIDYLINLVKTTEINAVVIDIKDYSGRVFYSMDVPDVKKYGAETIRIKDIDLLIRKLHREGIYVIARVTVFQDPILALFRPDLAVHSKSKLSLPTSTDFSLADLERNSLWLDNKELAWIDPAAKEAWDYNIAIAKDAVCHGFDEINFDYIRFPSDGDLNDMLFFVWDEETPKSIVMREFFSYLRQELADTKISADLFGLTTVYNTDIGIGQIIEDSFAYFDYVCPMVYPSHYADGFLGYQNPAEHPYEIIKDSMDAAFERLMSFRQTATFTQSQLRPWLQDFNLGAEYDSEMVRLEIKAVIDALQDDYSGFMLWSPHNIYTKGALEEN
ncbi:hypothetical protein KAR26_01310 [Candidatus Parcubacteria bacterium]|nr:hypothetical protein [Candidatus Parcubacteria bacterium]